MKSWKKPLMALSLMLVMTVVGCKLIETQADNPDSYLNTKSETVEMITKTGGALLPFPFDMIAIGAGTLLGAGWRQYVKNRQLMLARKDLDNVSLNSKRVALAMASVTQAIDWLKTQPAAQQTVDNLKAQITSKLEAAGIKEDATFLISQLRDTGVFNKLASDVNGSADGSTIVMPG